MLFRSCEWQKERKRRKRSMELYREKEECCGCGACAAACPSGAIRMTADREGFRYPEMDSESCLNCGRCAGVCPMKRRMEKGEWEVCIGARAKEDALREASSSGGVFPILAEYILGRQGVVFGAAYDENMTVVHRQACCKEELESLKKTKYVQSNMEEVFAKVDGLLRKGKWVLFCGTPCQAHGLKSFIGREEPKLVIVDLVCYGVPSPGIWRDYVRYLERKRGGRVTDFSFRDKRKRDNGHTCAYVAGGREYTGSLYRDLYCRMYFANHSLRPSCYRCRYATADRDSDITIGDFWGIEKIKPEMDDGMGISLAILHTEKARRLWTQVQEAFVWFSCGKDEIIQPRLVRATARAKGRDVFMALYRSLPFGLFVRLFGLAEAGKAVLRYFRGR